MTEPDDTIRVQRERATLFQRALPLFPEYAAILSDLENENTRRSLEDLAKAIVYLRETDAESLAARLHLRPLLASRSPDTLRDDLVGVLLACAKEIERTRTIVIRLTGHHTDVVASVLWLTEPIRVLERHLPDAQRLARYGNRLRESLQDDIEQQQACLDTLRFNGYPGAPATCRAERIVMQQAMLYMAQTIAAEHGMPKDDVRLLSRGAEFVVVPEEQ